MEAEWEPKAALKAAYIVASVSQYLRHVVIKEDNAS